MSASKEKIRRQEVKASGVTPKVAREAEAKKESKKVRTMAIVIAAVVVVLLAAALFINSKFVRRNLTALKINDVNYTVTDCNYYYYSTYFNYLNTIYSSFGDSASSMLPDNSKPFGSQIYDEETGKTWAEFFDEMSIAAMQDDAVILSEARKAGYQLPQDEVDAMNQEIEDLRANIGTYGSFSTLDDYLKSYYGNGMDEKSFRRVAEMKYMVDSYAEHVKDSYTYTPEEIEANYQENSNSFDTFEYRYFLVYAEEVDETLYEGDDAGLEQAEKEAMEAALEKAVAYAESIHSEADMIAAARDYNPATYAEKDSTYRSYRGELLGSIYGDWLREEGREEGQVTTAETTTGYYVVYFISRNDNHYNTVNARIMTVLPEVVDESQYAEDEDSTAYDAAVQAAYDAAMSEAQGYYDTWTGSGATEDAFITLCNDSSDDQTNEDGLYENIYRTQFTGDVDAWLYDSARKAGDHTVVSDGTNVYLIYFVGPGDLYSSVLSDNDLRTDEYNAWKESLADPTVQKTWVYSLAE